MPPALHYPDLQPPTGWHHFQAGLQIRLIPPDMDPEDATAAIIVSPLVPRQPHLPPPDKLVEQAIFLEARHRFEVLSQKGPMKAKGQGLEGVVYEVHGYPRPKFPREKRLYVMLADKLCYYGVSFQASEESYEKYVKDFWATAGSVRPFQGKILPPEDTSPMNLIYRD